MQIETIHEKGSGKINEDALLLADNTFGVFDGATSLNGFTTKTGETGGYLASHTALDIFRKHNFSLKERAEIANSAIAEMMNSYQIDTAQKLNLWSTSAAAIRLKKEQLEWIQTGDSDIILIFEDNSYQVIVESPNHDYKTLSRWKEQCHGEEGTIFDVLQEQLIAVRNEMNISYSVLNGDENAVELIKTGYHSMDQVKHILLFTDGLKIPSTEVSLQNNYDELIKVFLSKGLKGLKNYVRDLEKTDPKCLHFPRFKQHDDIAAVSVTL